MVQLILLEELQHVLFTLRGDGEAREVVLNRENSPSERGIILIRRLAPTESEFAAAALIAKGDICESL